MYVVDADHVAIDRFSAQGVYEEAHRISRASLPPGEPFEEPVSVSVDPATGNVYVVDEKAKVVDQFSSSGKYIQRIKGTGPGEPFVDPIGVAIQGSGAHKGDLYVSDAGKKVVDVFGLELPARPTVESESVAEVTSNSVDLGAEIDPRGVAGEYHFEYGPCSTPSTCATSPYQESVPVPDASVGSELDFSVYSVAGHTQDLLGNTTYHYRVVVHNAKGNAYGEDQTFTTQRSGSELGLPDGRQWEMVTPPEKHGTLFFGLNWGYVPNAIGGDAFVAEASAAGGAMIDLASVPTEAEPQGNTSIASVLSTRGPSGWSSQVIATPHDEAVGPLIGNGGEYRFFSEDLSQGVVQQFGNFTPLSPEASEATPYLRADYLNGNVNEHCQTSCYQPLVTRANTRAGAVFGEEISGECPSICGPRFLDATPDLSHIVLKSQVQLTSIFNPGPFYEWSGGVLAPLYLLPKGEGGEAVDAGELDQRATIDHQLADNGSVFFSYGGHLYLHDFAKGESVRLDVAQGVAEPSGGGAAFLYASGDGSRVLFTDSKQLTKAGNGGIYECRIVEGAGGLACELELTGLSGGAFVGGSRDASYLYFVGAGEKLIVDRHIGREWTTTEGPVIPQTSTSGFQSYGRGLPNYRVSPNGRFIAFMSDQNLTGYDNRDAISGRPDEEVYLYDASSNRLVCASCNPTGARPVGTKDNVSALTGGDFEGIWVAANLPPWTVVEGSSGQLYQPRFLSDSGRLFFDSADALVPQDVNGTQDVYEYEPVGVGSCSAASATFGERSDGCVGLISSGGSPEESAFLDASESGGDVFFLTTSKLAPQDYDNALDVYDAHECSAAVPCYPPAPIAPPACTTGDSCKAAPTLQPSIFGSPSSATFSGAGNVASGSAPVVKARSLTQAQRLARALAVCRKKRHSQRGVCERVARRRYGRAGKTARAGVKHRGRG